MQGVKWFLMPDHSRQKQERIDRRTEAFTSRYRSVKICKAFLGRDSSNKPLGRGSNSIKGLCGKRPFLLPVEISPLPQNKSVLEERMKARGLAFFHATCSMVKAIERFPVQLNEVGLKSSLWVQRAHSHQSFTI